MSTESNKKLMKAFYEAGARGDMEVCFEMLADDVTWTNIGSTKFSGTYRGKAQLLEKLLLPLFGELKSGISSEIENMIAEGDHVVVQTNGTAETTKGVPYNNSYCQVIRLRESKILEVKEYFDTELVSSVFGRGGTE
jgi:ketosteroid isomerase-like protein